LSIKTLWKDIETLVFASSVRETLTISFPKYLVDGSVTCFPLYCIHQYQCMCESTAQLMEWMEFFIKMRSDIQVTTCFRTCQTMPPLRPLICSVQTVLGEWKCSTQENCTASKCLINMSNTYKWPCPKSK
jgi:hypothetical protein